VVIAVFFAWAENHEQADNDQEDWPEQWFHLPFRIKITEKKNCAYEHKNQPTAVLKIIFNTDEQSESDQESFPTVYPLWYGEFKFFGEEKASDEYDEKTTCYFSSAVFAFPFFPHFDVMRFFCLLVHVMIFYQN
jgi:hypothetical protein